MGSARELDRLCESSDAYRWLCGGVGVNHHTLGDFRVEHTQWLDEQLTRNVAALRSQGLVSMTRVAHDGMRVRAAAEREQRIARAIEAMNELDKSLSGKRKRRHVEVAGQGAAVQEQAGQEARGARAGCGRASQRASIQ